VGWSPEGRERSSTQVLLVTKAGGDERAIFLEGFNVSVV
jgi:hypothetical protein